MRGNEFLDKMELVAPAYVEAADKTPKFRKRAWIKYGLAAACLCGALLVSFLAMPNENNVFVVNAYALDVAKDGSVRLKETDLLEQSDVLGGRFDGENFYLRIGLKYAGDNIKSVTFTTKEGFLAKQDISKLKLNENVSKLYVGPDMKLVVCGTEFENCGSEITIDNDASTDDLLLFWGTKANEFKELPESVEIIATAVFNDGTTQEIVVPLSVSVTGTIKAFIASFENTQSDT